MRQSVNAIGDDQATCAIPVAPVALDLGLLKAQRHSQGDRLRYLAIVALCLGFHAALLLLLETPPQPHGAPIEEAIPVEVIIEAPPEEKPPETANAEEAPPEQPAQSIEEKPATDFARSAEQERESDLAAGDTEKREPEAAAEAQPPVEQPAPDAPPEPISEPLLEPPPPAKAAPRFAGLTPLPDIQFKGAPSQRSEFPGGNADPGYMSTLYGLIMRKMPTLPHQSRPARGRVTFAVMSDGAIFQEAVAIPSGVPVLDAAALAAVRKAAPFPAPPRGGPLYIRFDYGSERNPSSAR